MHDLGLNPGRRGGKPATNSLSYGTAQHRSLEEDGFIAHSSYFEETKVGSYAISVLRVSVSPMSIPECLNQFL
jgi:hypothetical protein